jgi:VanZ family protein
LSIATNRPSSIITSMSPLYFTLALVVSGSLVLSAPFIGQIRNAIRTWFPGHFVLILASVVGVSVAGALGLALVRIRDRRRLRYTALGGALLFGVAYALWTAKPDPQINAVERFHFVQYGLVTLLFYKAWRPLDGAGVVLLPAVAALTVAMIEEWFQWFIPGRVGALEDVVLNWAAILCGLLFSVGLDPPARLELKLGRQSRRQLAVAAATMILVFGLFLDSVHLGYEITDPQAGRFTSLFTARQLQAHAQDRAERWRLHPPVDRTRLGREDQYRTEGLQHVQRRNDAWSEGDVDAAWRENLILETYYAPVLDARTRWPPEQRADAAERVASAVRTTSYTSRAYPYEIYTWRGWVFWPAILGLAAAVLVAGFVSAWSRITRADSTLGAG